MEAGTVAFPVPLLSLALTFDPLRATDISKIVHKCIFHSLLQTLLFNSDFWDSFAKGYKFLENCFVQNEKI